MSDKLQFVVFHDEDSIGENDKLKFVGRKNIPLDSILSYRVQNQNALTEA